MEYRVFGLFLVSLRCILMVTNSHAYKTSFDNLEDNIVEANNGHLSTSFASRTENDRASSMASSTENQVGQLEDIKESLQSLARGLINPLDQFPLRIDLESPVFREVLRRYLLTKMSAGEDAREDAVNTLRSLSPNFGKRQWSRVSVQTRFAPFGTKLVPNRKLENGGATLLRYGRDSQDH